MQVRRVVTGHDKTGKAKVWIDEVCHGESPRPGVEGCVVWATQGFPVVQDTDEDSSKSVTTTTLENGTVFRIGEYQPNQVGREHRTDSVDYAVVLKGEIVLELEGEEVLLKEGDVVVQRGTMHTWINRSAEPCRIAFILVSAKPVEVNGMRLDAMG